jgi:hypothetical protein
MEAAQMEILLGNQRMSHRKERTVVDRQMDTKIKNEKRNIGGV